MACWFVVVRLKDKGAGDDGGELFTSDGFGKLKVLIGFVAAKHSEAGPPSDAAMIARFAN